MRLFLKISTYIITGFLLKTNLCIKVDELVKLKLISYNTPEISLNVIFPMVFY